jgi:hypothetical protein
VAGMVRVIAAAAIQGKEEWVEVAKSKSVAKS